MKVSFRHAALAIAVLSLGLAGCGGDLHPSYSSDIKYGIRTDPILRGGAAPKLGEERFDPDRPGIFPIMKLDDIQNPHHPYHAKSKEINDLIFRDPSKIPEKDRKDLEAALAEMFGTPAKPTVNATAAGIAAEAIVELKLDDKTLAMGSTRYRIHCLHCHGVPGDGRGPTARWVNPHPRDFRSGLFKFQSVDQSVATSRPPARADLLRTLRQGVEGTAMPSFNLLKDDEQESLASYVIHLSLRGKVEQTIIMQAFDEEKNALTLKKDEDGDIKEGVKFYTKKYVADPKDGWLASNNVSSAIVVSPFPFDVNDMEAFAASVKRGQQIFTAIPSDGFKTEVFNRLFTKSFDTAKKGALSSAIAEAETKAISAGEAKALADAEAKAKAQKKTLSDEEIDKIKTAFEKEHDKIKESLKKDYPRIELELKQGEGKLEQDTRKAAELEVKAVLEGAKCVSCHTDYGRQARFRFDDWGTLVRPNNLSMGGLRGGKRPVDIYYRIHSGINGSGMTNFGKTFAGNEQNIWDLVNFVSVLPYPAMRDNLKLRID